jgi:hypothetical protein
MNKDEVIKLIKRNRNTKQEAIVLISDFLDISKSEAVKIYREEFEDNE